MQNISKILFETYSYFRNDKLKNRRFSHEMIKEMVLQLPLSFPSKVDVEEIGKSYQGREIYLLKIGKGKTKLLFWSQMHGDEATATAALLDMFYFLCKTSADFNKISNGNALYQMQQEILNNCTLYFVPMLNPDGATLWQRRTAQEIDMNRDAIALQTPEARLLKKLQQDLKPDFGFNLHDQNIYYTAGNTPNCASISFLAPPIDYEKTVNEVREKAMQIIGLLAEDLQQFIPNNVAKFSDDFEPRAFGDNIQRWGTSTILVESGSDANYRNDRDKQYIRKLNFVLLLNAAYLITNQAYKGVSLEKYHVIPQNEKLLKDLILRNVCCVSQNKKSKTNENCENHENYYLDIAFMTAEIANQNKLDIDNQELMQTDFLYISQIEDIGDLSVFYGYKEIDCKDFSVEIIGKLVVGENPTLIFRDLEGKEVMKVVNGEVLN
jgi:hypothetical protein